MDEAVKELRQAVLDKQFIVSAFFGGASTQLLLARALLEIEERLRKLEEMAAQARGR